ncbi:HlyD family efflux transporter periplasmic adaptor subunit [Herbaspirillum rubrisubalbicans]|nr:HlyD family efflux transporter periplasmic adaptor subunit [Herbaspirillum rubrisubalbicans]
MTMTLNMKKNDSHNPLVSARWMLRLSMLSVVLLLVWAAVSPIDQVTRAQGQVIAVSRTQSVQAPDGGPVKQILVKEGEAVKQGQLLMVLEQDRVQTSLNDSRAKVAALRISLARLRAEVYGQPLVFDPDLLDYKEYISNQKDLYVKRKTLIDQDLQALNDMLGLASQELEMNRNLEKTGDVGRADVLRLQRNVADIRAQINNKRNKYFQEALVDMTKVQEDLNTQREQLEDRSQVLEHTELKAPADGVVKNIRVTTIGGVVRPGDVVMEILPVDNLIVEVKVSTADSAYVKVGQQANVKLDAYDYSIYGTLNGHVVYVSPDTLLDETRQGAVPYYRVHIALEEAVFKGEKSSAIHVKPGMTATVEIKANTRTVLSFLVKPIAKTLQESMGER